MGKDIWFWKETGIEIGGQISSLASKEYKKLNFGEDWYQQIRPWHLSVSCIMPYSLISELYHTIANDRKKLLI